MKYTNKIKLLIACLFLFLIQQNIAFSALESTSVQPIHGTAPVFSDGWTGTGVVLVKGEYNKNLLFAEVGDAIAVGLLTSDLDGDKGILDNYYGVYGRKDSEGKDADTYLIFTDSSGKKTKIDPSELSINQIEDWGVEDDGGYMTKIWFRYILKPTDIGGKIGLNTAPVSLYGLPNVGKVYAYDNIFDNIPDFEPQEPEMPDVWPIRPNNKFQVGIWKTADVIGTGDEQKPPVGVKPYSHKDSTEFLSLNESYTALIWYDENENGVYDANELVFHKLHADPLQYKWSLQKGNSVANGTVPATKVIELVTSTDNTIVFPKTNAEALTKWPEAVANGLPKAEAGIQGFILAVDVE